MARKTVGKTENLRPFRKGYDPRRGVGKKGRSGRPPQEFREFMIALRRDSDVQDELRRVLLNGNSRGYAAALRALVEFDGGEDGPRRTVIVVPMSELEEYRQVAGVGRRQIAGASSSTEPARLPGYEYVVVDETPSEFLNANEADREPVARPRPKRTPEQEILARRHAERAGHLTGQRKPG